ncbi:virulence protein [Sporosarcina saromensis]|uniref:Virulence protein n=1 Tax=Sporosarcina saromensis TaxID=359365 RepID=A0ABU4G9L0_9BACL|nr:virulence protein [Sporosarcina saromensis]MDW0113640.1 virulence protein [Sporosarcina saromensis]
MIVKFNVKGKERKKLVEAISEHLNIPFEYKGTPSFVYEIGEYVVDRVGTLEGPTKDELIHALKSKYNFEAERDEQTETYTLSIEYPLDSFDEQTIENLEKLIQSKSTLIKRALAIKTTKIELEDDRISFPWFERELTSEELETYTKFIVALCETALKQKRVTAVEKQVENEKYAFRCFLLKLNFIGDEYKADRKLLMSKLSGDSSFKRTKKMVEAS